MRLQADFDCFYFVADWHAFTTEIPDKGEIAANTLEMAADWLGAGLDPERSTIFVQFARARARGAPPALLDDHAGPVARARPHVQGDARAARASSRRRTGSWATRCSSPRTS